MDPKACIQAIMRGNEPAEHARAYNAWRRNGGFAARAMLSKCDPEKGAYDVTEGDIDSLYRGHRGYRAVVLVWGKRETRYVSELTLS